MPLTSSVHVNQALTTFALGYGSQNGKFVADEVFPVIPAPKQADKYYITGMEHFDDHTGRMKRAQGGKYARVTHDYSTASFSCEDIGIEHPVEDTVQNNADTGLNPKENAVTIIRELMALAKEIRVSAVVTAATGLSYDAALAGGDMFDQSTSDPFGKIELLLDSVEDATGVRPNHLLMNRAVFKSLKTHADILDRIKYGGTNINPAMVTPAMIASLFDLDKLVIARAVYNSAKQGQTRSLSAIWPKSLLAYFKPTSIYFGTPTFGAQFAWYGDTAGQDLLVEEYREEQTRADIVRIRQNRDEVAVGPAFAARLTNVVS